MPSNNSDPTKLLHLLIKEFNLPPGKYTIDIPHTDVAEQQLANVQFIAAVPPIYKPIYHVCRPLDQRYGGCYKSTSLRNLVFQITNFEIRKSVNAREWLLRNNFHNQITVQDSPNSEERTFDL